MLKPYDVEQASAELSDVSMIQKHTRSPRKPKVKKLFVLDTNVLMHDPTSLFRFEEHDLYLPMGTLEELDSAPDVRSENRKAVAFCIPSRRNTPPPTLSSCVFRSSP